MENNKNTQLKLNSNGKIFISDGSVIIVGAVVTKDVPENCIAMGVPATVKDR